MKTLQKTLFIIGILILFPQTIRHTYLRWFEPRGSVLDKYEKPLNKEIKDAPSINFLLEEYEKAHKKSGASKSKDKDALEFSTYDDSEQQLKDAIKQWESQSKEIYELRFYWIIGFFAVFAGTLVYKKINSWLGFALIVTGFSEMGYWSSPSFKWASALHEYNLLLTNKLVLSLVAFILLILFWMKSDSKNDLANQP